MTNCPFCLSEHNKPIWNDWLRCKDCSLAFRKTYVEETVKVTKSNENRPAVWNDAQKQLYTDGLRRIEKLIGRKGKLLDIGCGHGAFIMDAIKNGWEAEGVEISDFALKQARDIFKLKVYDKPLSALNLPVNSYDAVTMWRVLDLIPDPKKELEEVKRILKPGGVVYIRVNNFDYHKIAFELGNTFIVKALNLKPGVVHRYGISKKPLQKVLEILGFTSVRIWNSQPTTGDSCNTGGKLGPLFIIGIKKLLFTVWQIIYYITFGKSCYSSSLLAIARKK